MVFLAAVAKGTRYGHVPELHRKLRVVLAWQDVFDWLGVGSIYQPSTAITATVVLFLQ
jgi:hypothetical protein